ncbi:MAG: enoyl-CoA hydratase/isomerase family protein [Promethearchaeota archaeon]|nr:MAG: enoyl-CoA hydratase/isomerase family protein [Candidatus Lokiarchaeota archaeon]
MEDVVLYQKEGDVGKIIINKPETHNSLDLHTMGKLIQAFEESTKNGDLCVIFTAEGSNFTVGDDLKYTHDLLNHVEKLPEAFKFVNTFQDLTRSMLNHPGIIIAGLHGWVIGGGFEMTLCCDLRIAASNTRIMMPELGVGLFFSNGSTKLLPKLIGQSRAKELMLLGKEISAEMALNYGLINEICKPEGLNRILKRTANSILQKSPISLRFFKKLLNENDEKDIEGVLDSEVIAIIAAGQSEEGKKRIEKFIKK